MNIAIEWSNGNPGALSFLCRLSTIDTQPIVTKLKEATSIRGTNLWVLYSDLCGSDMEKVKVLCEKCPTYILEDACSRQDYSGRALIAKYLEV